MKNLIRKTALTLTLALSSAAFAQPIVVVALAKVKPGTEEAFKIAANKILAPTRAEASNISYVYNQSTSDPTEFAFVEQWESNEAIDTHLQLPHMQAFFGEVGGFFEPGYPIINRYVRVGE